MNVRSTSKADNEFLIFFRWKVLKKSLVLVSLILCISISGFTQGRYDKTYFWLTGGLGVSSLGSLGGVASIHLQYQRILFGLRATANAESIEMFGGGDEMFDFGFLVGYVLSDARMILSTSTGLARVTGSRFHGQPGIFGGGHRESISPIIGVPFEFQAIYPVSSIFGLGAYGYLNLNREQTFFGITLCIAVGKLR